MRFSTKVDTMCLLDTPFWLLFYYCQCTENEINAKFLSFVCYFFGMSFVVCEHLFRLAVVLSKKQTESVVNKFDKHKRNPNKS